MANDTNVVSLSVSSYNQVKSDNYRLNLMLDNLLNEAGITEDHEHMVFNSRSVESAIKFCFPERFKKKMATLRTQASRFGTNVKQEGEGEQHE